MFKYAKITLLTLVAFLVLGFSITANAAKPDKAQLMVSAPLAGADFKCWPLNMSDRTIEVTIHYIDHTGVDESSSVILDPGESVWVIGWTATSLSMVHCEISWMGQPEDFRASFCKHYYSPDAVCLELF